MFDLEVIRPALLLNLKTVCDRHGLQQSPYMLGSPTPPTMQVSGVSDIEYDVAMQRGGDMNLVIVQAFVSMSSDIAGQQKLDKMLRSSGTLSVKEAIESDPTLGDIVDDLRVTRCSGHELYQRPGENNFVIGARWTVQVETTG